jgi:hypothetical protein
MFKTTDEIGFLGAGKVGRQVLIQTLDEALKHKGKVASEFFDRPFIFRLLFGAPLRTTIRFDFHEERAEKTDTEMVNKYLALPHETITDFFKGNIVMQEGYEITADNLRKLMKEKNVNTIEDFLAGFGFRKYEVYFRGTPRVSIEIRNVRNVKHAGGN